MENADSLPTLDEVLTADSTALRTLFEDVFNRPPPKWSRKDCLRGNLAWVIQASTQGHNPESLRQSLLITYAKQAGKTPALMHRLGTRLIREWQGQTYEVTILEKGYLCQGKTYRSLTSIAEAITGSHWSGNRFFGLKSRQNHGNG